MESEEASINLREGNKALEIGSGNNANDDGDEGHSGDDMGDDISKSSSKRKLTSDVWNHFKRVKIEKIQFGECNYCKTRLKAPSSHGTSHLKKHHEKTCRNRPRKMDIRQSLMMASKKASGIQNLTAHIFSQEDSRHKLAVMVILHDYALGIVDHEGFQDFVASFQPCFKMISRNTLKKDVLKIYNEEKIKCYKLLGKLKCRIAITTDMWTSNNTKKGFMAVTGHFIDDSWTLQSVILRFIYIPTPRTAEVLADKLVECFFDWNIDCKLSTITVDNCITNDAMIRFFLEKIPRKDFPLHGKVLQLSMIYQIVQQCLTRKKTMMMNIVLLMTKNIIRLILLYLVVSLDLKLWYSVLL